MRENKSAFVKIMGDTPYIRVMDFLLSEGRMFDYSLTDISKHTNVSWSTLHLVWPTFLKLGIVTKTRTVGRSKLYKLNEDNPLVKILVKCDFLLSKTVMDIKLGKINQNSDFFVKEEFEELSKQLQIA